MGQRGLVIGRALQQRRPEAQEAEIGLFGSGAGKAAKAAIEQFLRVRGQVARKGRHFSLAIEGFAIGGLAGRGRADDGRKFLPAPRDLRLNQRLAAREGPIVPVYVAPYPVEFLGAEVSLSVNTAAAGGNASLMTIG